MRGACGGSAPEFACRARPFTGTMSGEGVPMQSNPALRFNPHTYMNPLSRGAKIAIVTTVVVATGVTAFLLWPRSASAAELPPAPVPPTGGGGTTGGD